MMSDLKREMGRLQVRQGRMGTMMSTGMVMARDAVVPEPMEVIARKTVVTTSEAGEKELRDKLAIIATAFRNGIIEERQAIRLVTNLK